MTTKRSDDDSIISSNSNTGTVPSEQSMPILSSTPQNFQEPSLLSDEFILKDKKYRKIRQFSKSGEAEVFLVELEGKNLVFKLYHSQFKPKDEIVQKLRELHHPDIINLIDYGYYNGRFYEISEYAEGGSLDEHLPIKDMKILKDIVSETVNALKYCHSHEIIHRDLKPENIFYKNADKSDIMIGDFGISSALDEGLSKHFTGQARTTVYAAPEVFQSLKGKTLIGKEVDYYSFGITLLHIWSGIQPFEELSEFVIMRLKIDGKVFIPDDMPKELKTLIKGLITVEPPKRWGYEQIQRWLKNEDVEVYYKTDSAAYKDFSFGDQVVVTSLVEMADALEKYPLIGKKHLYRLTIANWVNNVNAALYIKLMEIVENDYKNDQDAGLIKAIYVLDPDRPFKGIDGTLLDTLENIGNFFENNFYKYLLEFKNPNASFYLYLEARGKKDVADEFRALKSKTGNKSLQDLSLPKALRNKKIETEISDEAVLNSIILYLQGGNVFKINELKFSHPKEFINVGIKIKDKLASMLSNINSKLSLWINKFTEYTTTINKWRSLKQYNSTTFMYALGCGFEFNGNIINDENEFRMLLREQYAQFFSKSNSANQEILDNASFWIKNYKSSSLPIIVYEFWLNGDYDADSYGAMLAYVVDNFSDTNVKILALIDDAIDRLEYFRKNKNRDLLTETLQIAKCIENEWTSNINGQFIEQSLNPFFDYIKSKDTAHSHFFSELLIKLEHAILNGINRDLKQIEITAGTSAKTYWDECHKILSHLNEHYANSHFMEFLKNVEDKIKDILNTIEEKNDAEQKQKIEYVDAEYEKRLKLQQDDILRHRPFLTYYPLFKKFFGISLGFLLLKLFATNDFINVFGPILLFYVGLPCVFTLVSIEYNENGLFEAIILFILIFINLVCMLKNIVYIFLINIITLGVCLGYKYNVLASVKLSETEIAAQYTARNQVKEYFKDKIMNEYNIAIFDAMMVCISDWYKKTVGPGDREKIREREQEIEQSRSV